MFNFFTSGPPLSSEPDENFIPIESSPSPKIGKRNDLNPVPGDIIRVRSGDIFHAMVYIKAGQDNDLVSSYVLHFYPVAPNGKTKGSKQAIGDFLREHSELEKLFNFSGGNPSDKPGCLALEELGEVIKANDECMVDNMEETARACGVTRRRKDVVIIEKAGAVFLNREKNPPPYNIAKFNCETFAMRLRYGADIPSPQAEKFKLPATLLGRTQQQLLSFPFSGRASGAEWMVNMFMDAFPRQIYPGKQYDLDNCN